MMVGAIDVSLGFDPGGKTGKKFFWCICLSDSGQLRVSETGNPTNVEGALKHASYRIPLEARLIF